MGVETILAVVTAAALAIVGLFFDRNSLEWLIEKLSANGFVITLIVFVSLVSIFGIVAMFLPRIRSWISQRLGYLHIKRICISVLLYILTFGLYGIVISVLLRTLWEVNIELRWYQFTWGFALAWVLGYITLGSPGGIGIREAVFVGLYGQGIGEGLAIGLAVVLRVVTTLGDLLAFGVAYWLGKQDSIATLEGKDMGPSHLSS